MILRKVGQKLSQNKENKSVNRYIKIVHHQLLMSFTLVKNHWRYRPNDRSW